jgi:hypothetical protein
VKLGALASNRLNRPCGIPERSPESGASYSIGPQRYRRKQESGSKQTSGSDFHTVIPFGFGEPIPFRQDNKQQV